MSMNPIPAEEIRAALRPYQADASTFEAGIRTRIETMPAANENDTSQNLSSMQQLAAALLPWPVVVGGKVVGSGTKLSSLAFGPKILGYAALPAVSLFLMIGAAIFSALRIRSIQNESQPATDDYDEMQAAIRQWWANYKWPAWIVYAAALVSPLIGSTWVFFLFLLVSFGVLLFLLSSFSRLGVGNQLVIAQSCLASFGLLGGMMINPFAGKAGIHFVNQKMITVVFYCGVLFLLPVVVRNMKKARTSGVASNLTKIPMFSMLAAGRYKSAVAMTLLSALPLIVWICNPLIWPATPVRIQNYVESFEKDSYPSIEWRRWEIVARWSIDAGQNPDLSVGRQRLADEISRGPNSFVLGSAFRAGIVETDQINQLQGLERWYQILIGDHDSQEIYGFTFLMQRVWVIHALEQSGRLTDDDRDFVEKRLLATFDELITEDMGGVLEDVLCITQLLQVIHRPIDRDKYRSQVHQWLREYHCTETGGFALAGGFKQYKKSSSSALETTAYAVELMQIYGVPEGLDINWVRSYLKPDCMLLGNDKWVAAVTLDRLNHLPGVTQPTWPQIVYYERSLIAAILLVVLCLYATLSAPKATLESLSTQYAVSGDGDQDNSEQNGESQINS